MRRDLKLAVILAVLAATPVLGRAADTSGGKKTRIAVLDVQYAGVGDRKTVEGLSALLASEVARRPELMVIAGSDLRALLGFERQKQLLGCSADASCIAELAGALGVAYLVSSEASKLGNTWLLSLALLDAKKAMAVNRLTRKAYSDDALVEEASKAVDELLGSMPGLAPVPAGASAAIPPAPPPSAQVVPPSADGMQPGYHTHDGGFFRVQLGGGSLSSSASTPLAGELKVSGASGSIGLGVGYAIVPNLVVLGEFYSLVDTNPTFTIAGQSLTSSNVSHSFTGFGIGVSYYLASINAYGEVTVGAGKINLDDGTTTYSTESGAVLRLGIGKEWWVSTNWGLGVGLNAFFGSMKDKGTDPATWKTTAVALAVSATYN